MARRVGRRPGGISGLLRLIDEHGGALEYDLITRAGVTLDDVPARISWRALNSFVMHLDMSSALMKELRPEYGGWQGAERVPPMLADLIDAVNAFRWAFECANTPRKRRRPPKPKPYPRPGAKEEGGRIGRDPIPIKDFDRWWKGEDADA